MWSHVVEGVWVQGQLEYAVAGLFVAGLSDWADGFVAKSYAFQSVLGSYLDPLADKAVIAATTLGAHAAY